MALKSPAYAGGSGAQSVPYPFQSLVAASVPWLWPCHCDLGLCGKQYLFSFLVKSPSASSPKKGNVIVS